MGLRKFRQYYLGSEPYFLWVVEGGEYCGMRAVQKWEVRGGKKYGTVWLVPKS